MVTVVTEKQQKQLFYSINVILTSVTIIKQVFLRKLFCYESLLDIEVSKH